MASTYLCLIVFAVIVVQTSVTFSRADEICCPGAGSCFNSNPPFQMLPLPQCAEDLQMSMKVYTKQNPTTGQDISRSQTPAAFDGSRLTIFIVHGWTQSESSDWMTAMKNAFLKQGDYNVVIVGWKGGSQNFFYPQSAANTRSVGTEIGLVAANLIASGNSDKSRLYCVGHSLGSHICGHAGMKTKFGRITGLDPAGPLFEDRPSTAGLNPTSADLVDAIHTDGQGNFLSYFAHCGTLNPVGHVDFYPNGGKAQPNCILEGGAITDILHPDLTVACNHGRAIGLYTESILTPCFNSRYTACTEPKNLPNSCTQTNTVVQTMGFNSSSYSARGVFYLPTKGTPPYCSG